MFVYLPIAEMPADALLIIALSAAIGFVSGLVGVGGGFIITPFLIFVGIPPGVAVATGASQVTAASVSGIMSHWARRAVDLRMGLLLTLGGIVGVTAGVWLFARLSAQGVIDQAITGLYIALLALVGLLMAVEAARALRRKPSATPVVVPRRSRRTLLHALPWRMRFPISGLYISIVPVLALGFLTGVLAALMGVGGGFLLTPAMLYILRMPTNVVVGTALIQILVTTAYVTFLQSATTQMVDLVLAALLVIGGVIGAPLGAMYTARLKGEYIRLILAVLLLLTALKLVFDLMSPPAELFLLERR